MPAIRHGGRDARPASRQRSDPPHRADRDGRRPGAWGDGEDRSAVDLQVEHHAHHGELRAFAPESRRRAAHPEGAPTMASAERHFPLPAKFPALTIRGLRTRALRVPMRRPLGTSRGNITHAPLVLLDLETEEGVPGRAYLFAYQDVGAQALRQLLSTMLEIVRGDARRARRGGAEAPLPLHADGAGRAPHHGHGGRGLRALGRHGARGGNAALPPSRRRAPPGAGVQQQCAGARCSREGRRFKQWSSWRKGSTPSSFAWDADPPPTICGRRAPCAPGFRPRRS